MPINTNSLISFYIVPGALGTLYKKFNIFTEKIYFICEGKISAIDLAEQNFTCGKNRLKNMVSIGKR
jgi:hypothetical protein